MEIGTAAAVTRCRDCGGTGSPGAIAGNRIVCGTCHGTGRVLAEFAAILPLPEKEEEDS